ncbi:hypothetical protein AKJ16_DCAP10881 [Drosera capensis]
MMEEISWSGSCSSSSPSKSEMISNIDFCRFTQYGQIDGCARFSLHGLDKLRFRPPRICRVSYSRSGVSWLDASVTVDPPIELSNGGEASRSPVMVMGNCDL